MRELFTGILVDGRIPTKDFHCSRNFGVRAGAHAKFKTVQAGGLQTNQRVAFGR